MLYFHLCSTDDFARNLLYKEVPAYYDWRNNTFPVVSWVLLFLDILPLRRTTFWDVYTQFILIPATDTIFGFFFMRCVVQPHSTPSRLLAEKCCLLFTPPALPWVCCRTIRIRLIHSRMPFFYSHPPHKLARPFCDDACFLSDVGPYYFVGQVQGFFYEDLLRDLDIACDGVVLTNRVDLAENKCLLLMQVKRLFAKLSRKSHIVDFLCISLTVPFFLNLIFLGPFGNVCHFIS